MNIEVTQTAPLQKSLQTKYFLLSTTEQNSRLNTASLQEENTNLTFQDGKK